LNLTNPKFQDPRVRQALALGIDRPALVDLLLDGYGAFVPTAAWPFVLDNFPGEAELGNWWRHDPAEATKLLSAAGAEGLEFAVIQSPQYGPAALREDEILAEMWADIGVTLNIQNIDYTEFNTQWVGISYPEAADGWATAAPSADGFYKDQVYSTSKNNRWYINDPEIDAWADEQSMELDPAARREIQRKIWDKLQDQQYRIETTQAFVITAYSPQMRGARFNGAYISYHYFYKFGQNYPTIWLAP
jgi:peptide/nickel transport system substrate-binding protein